MGSGGVGGFEFVFAAQADPNRIQDYAQIRLASPSTPPKIAWLGLAAPPQRTDKCGTTWVKVGYLIVTAQLLSRRVHLVLNMVALVAHAHRFGSQTEGRQRDLLRAARPTEDEPAPAAHTTPHQYQHLVSVRTGGDHTQRHGVERTFDSGVGAGRSENRPRRRCSCCRCCRAPTPEARWLVRQWTRPTKARRTRTPASSSGPARQCRRTAAAPSRWPSTHSPHGTRCASPAFERELPPPLSCEECRGRQRGRGAVRRPTSELRPPVSGACRVGRIWSPRGWATMCWLRSW